jgi:hypothetical protein
VNNAFNVVADMEIMRVVRIRQLNPFENDPSSASGRHQELIAIFFLEYQLAKGLQLLH